MTPSCTRLPPPTSIPDLPCFELQARTEVPWLRLGSLDHFLTIHTTACLPGVVPTPRESVVPGLACPKSMRERGTCKDTFPFPHMGVDIWGQALAARLQSHFGSCMPPTCLCPGRVWTYLPLILSLKGIKSPCMYLARKSAPSLKHTLQSRTPRTPPPFQMTRSWFSFWFSSTLAACVFLPAHPPRQAPP